MSSPQASHATDLATMLEINGHHLQGMLNAGHDWLAQHREHVNALNVFPVPDGDTGNNMVQTMREACRRATGDYAADIVAQQAAEGAFMGARGNSGVILSQILHGFAAGIKSQETLDGRLLATGLQLAVQYARRGVEAPVEGTILTVIHAAADGAAANPNGTPLSVLEDALAASRVALAHTPEQLPILKQAGVVDAGGQGLVYIFEGMARFLRGESAETTPLTNAQPITAQELARPADGQVENPYDVQFLLHGDQLDLNTVRQSISAMGDSAVIVGDERIIKVHIHVKDPGQPLSYGVSLGTISDVVVENMQAQMEEIIGDNHLMDATVTTAQIGVVAVATGSGIQSAFRGLGAAVIDGGQTSNPSTQEILQAIDALPSKRVIVLPNNKNIMMAAQAAAELSAKQVVVIPTRSVPQGIAAMINYAADGQLAEVAQGMEDAAEEVGSAEITHAIRAVTIDQVDVALGQLIAIVDGKLCAAGDHLTDILPAMLAHLDMDERELLTLYFGAETNEQAATTFATAINASYPDIEIEIVNGGQPHYLYILGVE